MVNSDGNVGYLSIATGAFHGIRTGDRHLDGETCMAV